MSINWTEQQKQIFLSIGSNDSNIMVQATAGSGKTGTIVESCNHIPGLGMDVRVLLCSFGRAIADELAKRVPWGVESNTLNAIGNGVLRNQGRGYKVNKFKDWNILKSVVGGQNDDYYKLRGIVDRIIGLLKNNLVEGDIVGSINRMVVQHGIDIPSKYLDGSFEQIMESVYLRSLMDSKEISFDDQKLIVVRNRAIGEPIYDIVMVDEAQDLSPLDVELVSLLGRRIIAVGDMDQAIYGWRGSMSDAMDTIKDRFGCIELPLSICWRCPEDVIKEAKNYSDKIQCPTEYGLVNRNGVGLVEDLSKEKMRERFGETDNDRLKDIMVLCRMTAPLISECLKLLPYKKCFVKGREIGEGLIRIIDTVCGGDGYMKIEMFDGRLDDYVSEHQEILEKLNREAALTEFNDKIDSIKVLEEKCKDVMGLKQLINEVIVDNGDGVMFATQHKSKGLERKEIYWYERRLNPHKKARLDWQIQQEKNLMFVTASRSQHGLYII